MTANISLLEKPESRTIGARAWNNLTVSVVCILVAYAGWRHRAITDDGAIFLRTVRQILAGNGVVVNTGERIEANTSTLWQWTLVLLGGVLPGDLGFIAVVAGLLLTVAGFWLALDACRRLHAPDGTRYLLPFGVLVPLAVTAFWDFFTAALDSGLMFFWLGTCWWLTVRLRTRPGAKELALHGAWYGLGVLVRPDMMLIAAVFFVFSAWISHASWRDVAIRGAAAGALPLAYEVFRAGYYGILVPLPALTKEAGSTEWGRGFRYAWDFTEPYFLYVPLGLLLLYSVLFLKGRVLKGRLLKGPRPGADRTALIPVVPVVGSIALLAYVLKLGGDYMHGRMLLPVTFLLVLPVMLIPFGRRTGALATLMLAWAVVCTGPWNPGAYDGHDASTTARVRNSDIKITQNPNADRISDWVTAFPGLQESVRAATTAQGPVFVQIGKGGSPVAMYPLNPALGTDVSIPGGYLGVTGAIVPLDRRIAEVWGLANTVGAHLEYAADWRKHWPGHRKLLGDVWLLAMELDPAVPTPSDTYPHVSADALAAARRVLGCGQVKELLDSVRQPLTFGRFFDNLTGSVRRTNLRIPRDPFAAERKFC